MNRTPQIQAAIELFFSSMIWGFGFIAAVWALEILTPPELLFLRFLFAFLIGEGLSFFANRRTLSFLEIRQGLFAGFILGAVLLLQTWGLLYTTATKSGFITSLYVILIPLFLKIFWKIKTPKSVFINVFLALFGTAILVSPSSFENPFNSSFHFSINHGDTLTFYCAIFAAFHIIYIDKKSKQILNGFQFNNYQSLGAALFCVPNLIFQHQSHGFFEKVSVNSFFDQKLAWFGLFSLSVGSSLLAFYIQIRTQKVLKPTTASLFFLLEAPFALFFAVLFLKEQFSALQFVGMAIVLLACLKQLLSERGEANS